ncbi:UNVERIFIED_CONTAM: hypothetical protein C7454_103183 [Acidovorax defluvii]
MVCFCGRREPGLGPAADSLFFASPKKSKQKKGDPAVCDPCGANLRRGVCGVRRGTRYALARCARTTTASQITKHARSDAHATPQTPRRRRSQKGVGSPTAQQPNSPTATRAVAALGPDGRRRFAPRSARPSAAMARRDVRLRDPFRMRRGAQRSADQGSRLSERRRREFERDPAGREHRRLPAAKRRDAACRVAFLLGTFLWRSKEKYLARRGETRPPP